MKATSVLWKAFWNACLETPRGMVAPFIAFWRVATRNPVLGKHQVPDKDQTHAHA